MRDEVFRPEAGHMGLLVHVWSFLGKKRRAGLKSSRITKENNMIQRAQWEWLPDIVDMTR